MDSLLTVAARRHIRLLARALAPLAGRIERRFRARLRELRYDSAHIRSLLAISPVAAAGARSIGKFRDEVEYHGRRLSKLNMPLADVKQRPWRNSRRRRTSFSRALTHLPASSFN